MTYFFKSIFLIIMLALISCSGSKDTDPADIASEIKSQGVKAYFEKHSQSERYGRLEEPILTYMITENDDMAVIKGLVEYGVDINEKDRIGYNPLLNAVLYEKTKVVNYLIEQGAQLDPFIEYAGYKRDVLSVLLGNRASREMIQHLYDKGMLTDEIKNEEVLIYAVIYNDIELIDLLIEKGADINTQTDVGRTALLSAIDYGMEELALDLLERGAKPLESKYLNGNTYEEIVKRKGMKRLSKALSSRVKSNINN